MAGSHAAAEEVGADDEYLLLLRLRLPREPDEGLEHVPRLLSQHLSKGVFVS